MSALARLLDDIVSENEAAASSGYISALAGDAPGLVERFGDHWLDLQRQIAHLPTARGLIAQRITIEQLLVAATRAGSLVTAALADQYVNLVDEPQVLDRLVISPHNGDGWTDSVLAEIEAIEKAVAIATTTVARWELLFRAAALMQVIISESLTALAENIAADLRSAGTNGT